jgi:hypothetical protein
MHGCRRTKTPDTSVTSSESKLRTDSKAAAQSTENTTEVAPVKSTSKTTTNHVKQNNTLPENPTVAVVPAVDSSAEKPSAVTQTTTNVSVQPSVESSSNPAPAVSDSSKKPSRISVPAAAPESIPSGQTTSINVQENTDPSSPSVAVSNSSVPAAAGATEANLQQSSPSTSTSESLSHRPPVEAPAASGSLEQHVSSAVQHGESASNGTPTNDPVAKLLNPYPNNQIPCGRDSGSSAEVCLAREIPLANHLLQQTL